MRSKFPLLLLIPILTLFITCATDTKTEAVDMDKAKLEIQAMEDAYAAAEKAKDPAAIVAYYHADAISYHDNEPISSGREAIKEYHAKRIAADTSGTTNVYKVQDIFAEGDMLVEVGSWTELDPAGAQVDNGYYMSYFKKTDGKYLCVRDMAVSVNPKK